MIGRLSAVGIIGSILLSVFRSIAGIADNPGAVISDAVHSTSDTVAAVAAYFGAELGCMGNGESRPCGHERILCPTVLFSLK